MFHTVQNLASLNMFCHIPAPLIPLSVDSRIVHIYS